MKKDGKKSIKTEPKVLESRIHFLSLGIWVKVKRFVAYNILFRVASLTSFRFAKSLPLHGHGRN